MAPISLSVNGTAVQADVEPRTHLADFLRGHLLLTGTHLGCEQGVCGACTVIMDGRPQRSCIALAVDCDGADITTIEGFDADPLMIELREAFADLHALQCGFCTPGMLASARDIVMRLGDVPEARIREELGGNICRCTGYVGIVDAVKRVATGKHPQAAIASAPVAARVAEVERPEGAPIAPQASPAPAAARSAPDGTTIEQRLRIAADPAIVWAALSDLRGVAACLPGAEITAIDGDQVSGRMHVALGPIRAAFGGQATVTMDATRREGRMAGQGRDSRLGSSAAGEAHWRVVAGDADDSLVIVALTWRLKGALAQFNRPGLVQDIVARLAAAFVANLEASLSGRAPSDNAVKPLGGLGLLWSIVKARLFKR